MASCGGTHCMTVSSAGALFAWGSGIDGRLGHGSIKDKSEPMRVENVSMEQDGEIVVKEQDGMKIVWTHAVAGETHSCGVTDDGGLYTWGNGQDGAWEPLFCVYTACFTVCVKHAVFPSAYTHLVQGCVHGCVSVHAYMRSIGRSAPCSQLEDAHTYSSFHARHTFNTYTLCSTYSTHTHYVQRIHIHELST